MSSRVQRIGTVRARSLARQRGVLRSWNAGLNQSYRSRLPLKKPGVANYYNAGVMTAYGDLRGAKAELGDLFNDVMGAVVPGWEARPDWMKKLVVKPDPNKLIQAAQKVAPNAAGQIVGAAEKAGFNLFVNTPGGQVPVTPGMAQGAYSNLPWVMQGRQAISDIPTWVWMAGAGGLALVLVLGVRR